MQVLRDELYRPWFANETDWGFEIIDGEYSNTVVQIESIEFSTVEEGKVDLKFHVVKKPEDEVEIDITSDLFNQTVELIINDILREAINIHEQARANDSQEPGT